VERVLTAGIKAAMTAPAPRGAHAASAAREFEYTTADFERIRKLIYQRAGISLSASKQDMVYSRLARRMRALGLKRFSDYLDRLHTDSGPEWEAFTNALTTNLTSFFREEHHFPILARHIGALTRRPLAIWCCAASTGEEPYSLAMTMVELFGSFQPPVTILATDVDTQVLRHAEQGVYSEERVAKLSAERTRRFFLRGAGAQGGCVQVRDELRRLVTFRQVNLLEAAWPVRGPLDAIFCRNVLIYFDRATQAAILRRFVPLMRRDALLFIGHSESLFHVSDLFRLQGQTVYALASRTQR
jgi:chemotaxis protein methyltransferase CheR